MKDALSDVFETIRLRATLYFRTDFSPPWSIAVPAYQNAARFHLVVQGACHVSLADGRSVELGPGDLVLAPQGRAHVLSDRAGRTPTELETVLTRVGYDGDGVFVVDGGDPGAATQMVCGHFGFAEGADHPLLRALPPLIHVTTSDRARYSFLDEALRMLVMRVFSDGMGAAAAVSRLSEVFFIEAVRAGVAQSPEIARILEAFADAQVGRALNLMHREPHKAWTVDGLARAVGMSRSRFAQRFSDLIGDGPMRYLAEWRLQRALLLLSEPRVNIQEVAGKVGYQSAAAFTRAFTAKFGASPSERRRAAS